MKERFESWTSNSYKDVTFIVIPGGMQTGILDELHKFVRREAGGDPRRLKVDVYMFSGFSEACHTHLEAKIGLDQVTEGVTHNFGEYIGLLQNLMLGGPGDEIIWKHQVSINQQVKSLTS